MITHGEEFKIAQLIALILIIPTFLYMITVCKSDIRWRNITYAVGFLFLSTTFAFLREFYYFDTFRTLEWIFIFIAAILFTYAAYSSNKNLKLMKGEY